MALINREYENLRWPDIFDKFKLVRLRIPIDGLSLLHAIVKSYLPDYIAGTINRRDFLLSFRTQLYEKLDKYYNNLSDGKLKELSEKFPEYTLENLKNNLLNGNINNIYSEFISNIIDKDIYFLDFNDKDVYIPETELKYLYKGRDSIIILRLNNHYELIGELENFDIKTLFMKDDDIIRIIKERVYYKNKY